MRFALAYLALSISCVSHAETTYLGLYLHGQKIGYACYDTASSKYLGKPALKSNSRTVMDTSLLGTSMIIQMDSITWTTPSGQPLRMWSDTKSDGRSNKVDALFGPKSVSLNIENGGIRSKRALPIPVGGRVVDDPLTLVINGGMKTGSTRSFFVLDPSTASFIKNEIKVIGRSIATVRSKAINATLIEVSDTRATMKVYVGHKGELLIVQGPAGIDMIPVSREIALGKNSKYQPSTDLAFSTSIKTDKPIENPSSLTHLKLRISGRNLSHVPSDQHQSVTKSGSAWILDIHPIQLIAEPPCTISTAAKGKPEWLKPSLNIPSDSPRFMKLSAKIIGSKNDVQDAAFALQTYVYENMQPNAGIGVLRDATEVLDTKEGVCRDYATLTVTLLRAARIPARLASGLVNWDGTFYYHAWAEAWNGVHWFGVDATTDKAQLSAAHVKLGDGNVDTAFSFTFLEKARIDVLNARKD